MFNNKWSTGKNLKKRKEKKPHSFWKLGQFLVSVVHCQSEQSINIEEDHQMSIPTKLDFNLPSGFREEWNVNFQKKDDSHKVITIPYMTLYVKVPEKWVDSSGKWPGDFQKNLVQYQEKHSMLSVK